MKSTSRSNKEAMKRQKEKKVVYDIDDRLLGFIRESKNPYDRMNILIPPMQCVCGNREIASKYEKFLKMIDPDGENPIPSLEALDLLGLYNGCCRSHIVSPLSVDLINYYFDVSHRDQEETYLKSSKKIINQDDTSSNFFIDEEGNIIGKGARIQNYLIIDKVQGGPGESHRIAKIPVIKRPIIISHIGVKDAWKTSAIHGHELIGKSEALTKAIKRSDYITVMSLVDRGTKPTSEHYQLALNIIHDPKFNSRSEQGRQASNIEEILRKMK